MNSQRNGICSLLLVMSTIVCAAPCCAQNKEIKEVGRIITANGDAALETTPDKVIVQLGVRTWDKDLRKAYQDNATRTKAILELQPKYKIDKTEIQTTEFAVRPTYRQSTSYGSGSSYAPTSDPEPKDPVGYEVTQNVALILRAPDSLPDFLAAAFDAGANSVETIKFDTSDSRKLRDDARALALQAAKEKAEAMAAQYNAKLGRPIVIKENENQGNTNLSFSRFVPNNRLVRAAQPDAVQSLGTSNVAPGVIKVNSSVTVTFDLTD